MKDLGRGEGGPGRGHIGRLDPVLKGLSGIIESQIVQEELDRLVVRIVPASDLRHEVLDLLEANMRKRSEGWCRSDPTRLFHSERSEREAPGPGFFGAGPISNPLLRDSGAAAGPNEYLGSDRRRVLRVAT